MLSAYDLKNNKQPLLRAILSCFLQMFCVSSFGISSFLRFPFEVRQFVCALGESGTVIFFSRQEGKEHSVLKKESCRKFAKPLDPFFVKLPSFF